MAAVDGENCGKLGAVPALLFTGKVDIWADHAGAFDCGVEAEPVVFGAPLPAADVSPGAPDELILPSQALRSGPCH
jgi:hypothetical protein